MDIRLILGYRQAVKAPGFDPGREGTLFTLVRIQLAQLVSDFGIETFSTTYGARL